MPHMLAAEHLSYVNALNYGSARNDATISAALAAIASAPAILLFAHDGDGIWTLNSPHTFPVNVILAIPAGVAIAGSGALTINGLVRADSAIWYAGTGSVTFPPSDVFVYFNKILTRQLGLNTNTPLAQIHASGDSSAPATILVEQRTLGAGNAGLLCWSQGGTAGGGGEAFVGLQAGGTGRDLLFSTVGAGNFLFGGVTGKIGYHITNPQASLHIGGDNTLPASILVEEVGGGGGATYSWKTGGTVRAALGVQTGTTDLTLNMQGGVRFIIGGTGANQVGIGLTNPAHLLQLGLDDAWKPGTNTWTVSSDGRTKEEDSPFTDGLNVVLNVRPIRYRYNGKGGTPTDNNVEIGVIAQELDPYAPYMITHTQGKLDESDATTTDLLGYQGHAMSFVLVNAVKELAATCDAQAHQIATLQSQVADLTTRLAALEALAGTRFSDLEAVEAIAHRHTGTGSAQKEVAYTPPASTAASQDAPQKKRHAR